MGIADFFRPKHRHSDVRVRTEAVKALTSDDAAILIQIARSDRDIGVRRIAIEKIDAAEVLADIAAQESERSLRDFAGARAARLWMSMACSADAEKAGVAVSGMIKLGDQHALVEVVVRAETPAVRKRAFGELRDPRALAELAKRDAASDLRIGAVARIDDGDVLRALAIDTTSKEVGLAAVEKLEDLDRLEHVAQKAKNKAVRQKARKIVTEINEAERAKKTPSVPDDVKRRRAEKAQLIRQLEGVADTYDFAKAAPMVTAAEASWAALGDLVEEGDDRFTKAVKRFWKRKANHDSQARTADELRAVEREATAQRAKERAAAAAAAAAPKPEPEPVAAAEPESEEQRLAREAEGAARREERQRLEAENEARRAAQAEERAARQKEDADRAAAIGASLAALVEDMEKLAGEDARETRGIDRVLSQAGKAFDQVGKAPPELRDALAERYRVARAKLVTRVGEAREAEDWLRWSNVPKAEALIATAKGMLDEPPTPDLGNRLRGLQALWKEVGPMPTRRSKELWDQFKAGCDLVYEKVRGQRAVEQEKYAEVITAKEALIAEAEVVADSTDWTATAEKLKALQQQWKSSGHLPRKQGDDLWKRFRAACDKFFERRKPLLEARDAEEADNLAKKHALVAAAARVADTAPNDGGWGKAISEIKNLQQQWKEIGYVPRRDADTVYRAFRTACDRLFTKRGEARDSEANAHRAEIDAIKAEIDAVMAGGDDVVARALAVRTKAEEHGGFVAELDAMIRHVVTAHADAVKGTALDPSALRARRDKLIARAEELVPKQAADAPATVDLATQLKQAMRKNAFGDLRFSGRDPIEVIDELRASWAESGPFFDESDHAQTARFEAVVQRVIETTGATPRPERAERAERDDRGGEGRRKRRDRPDVAGPDTTTAPMPVVIAPVVPPAIELSVPVAAHDAETTPTVVPELRPAVVAIPSTEAVTTRAKPITLAPPPEVLDTGWDLGDEDPTAGEASAPETAVAPDLSVRTISPAFAAAKAAADAQQAAEPDLAEVAEAVAGPEPTESDKPAEETTTPSSSEMAGDGATEGDGIDAGWD